MIISGKDLSARMKAEMAEQVKAFPVKYGRVPHLVVVLVGDDPASVSYVTGKAKASAEVGIRNTTLRRSAEISEEELLALIDELNADDEVDGILVQLPLPRHIDEQKVIAAIRRELPLARPLIQLHLFDEVKGVQLHHGVDQFLHPGRPQREHVFGKRIAAICQFDFCRLDRQKIFCLKRLVQILLPYPNIKAIGRIRRVFILPVRTDDLLDLVFDVDELLLRKGILRSELRKFLLQFGKIALQLLFSLRELFVFFGKLLVLPRQLVDLLLQIARPSARGQQDRRCRHRDRKQQTYDHLLHAILLPICHFYHNSIVSPLSISVNTYF